MDESNISDLWPGDNSIYEWMWMSHTLLWRVNISIIISLVSFFKEKNNKIPVPYSAHLEGLQIFIFMNHILIDKHSIDQVNV